MKRPRVHFVNIRWVVFGAVIVCLFGLSAEARYSGGVGEPNNPYRIVTANDLNDIGNHPNDFDKHFILINDINLAEYTGTQFNIIGNDVNEFTGVFDGNGHTISNFTYESNGIHQIGLFGCIYDANAEIGNLGLLDPNVNAGTGGGVGALVGTLLDGIISNCYAESGTVSGGGYVGGLVGYVIDGNVIDCHFVGVVSGVWTDTDVGGLIGLCRGQSCPIGGLVENCYSEGIVSGNSYVGGLVGNNCYGHIFNSYSTSSVSGHDHVGGLVGLHYTLYCPSPPTISKCYSLGSVSGSDDIIGGLVGHNRSVVTDCYSTASVSGGDYIGGLVGKNSEEIINCYSTGIVSGDSGVGGLVGDDDSGVYTKSFWDSNVNPDVNGIGNWDDPNVIGKTTAEMQTESTFTDAGWDFVGEVVNGPNDFWDICEGTNYPKLVWQIPVGDFVCPDGVTFIDFSVLGTAWMCEPNDYCWNPNCDISEPNDNIINESDVMVFTDNWLEGI